MEFLDDMIEGGRRMLQLQIKVCSYNFPGSESGDLLDRWNLEEVKVEVKVEAMLSDYVNISAFIARSQQPAARRRSKAMEFNVTYQARLFGYSRWPRVA